MVSEWQTIFCQRREWKETGFELWIYTVTKSYLFFEGGSKFPAPSREKFLLDFFLISQNYVSEE